MSTTEVFITCTKEMAQWICAHLNTIDHNGILEEENGVKVYVQPNQEPALMTLLDNLKTHYNFTLSAKEIKEENWNAKWESNYQPVVVGGFCSVIAPFHTPNVATKHNIVINPKMAFGTGHHATTQMMIGHMQNMDFSHKKVLDLGCGTGVLAILAALEGAKSIVAVDYDIHAYISCKEATEINNTPSVEVIHGTLAYVKREHFNLILANINRNYLLENANRIAAKMSTGGHLVISGFRIEDEKLVKKKFEQAHFKIKTTLNRDNWAAILLKKI